MRNFDLFKNSCNICGKAKIINHPEYFGKGVIYCKKYDIDIVQNESKESWCYYIPCKQCPKRKKFLLIQKLRNM